MNGDNCRAVQTMFRKEAAELGLPPLLLLMDEQRPNDLRRLALKGEHSDALLSGDKDYAEDLRAASHLVICQGLRPPLAHYQREYRSRQPLTLEVIESLVRMQTVDADSKGKVLRRLVKQLASQAACRCPLLI
jgi:hypothetical protein